MRIGKSVLDREALVARNRRMADAFHTTPLRHRIRRVLLGLVAQSPVPTARPRGTNRVLLIRPDHLGDVLLTTPAIHALRAALPNAELHALVGPWSAEAVAGYPELDVVLTLPFPGFSRRPGGNWRSPYELAVHAAGHLRRIGYDSAVIFRPDHWWGALLAKLAGIPERIGYDLPDVAPFLTSRIPREKEHVVLQSMRLVERWTGAIAAEEVAYRFPVEPHQDDYIDRSLRRQGIPPGQPVICIHAGSGTRVKQWADDRWAGVADALHERFDAPIIFTGADHELPLVQRIAAQMKYAPCLMVGDTRVAQLAALFSRAKVVLGPDSGPLHLAVAVGVPTVTLFGPADPAEFGPWGSPERHAVLTSNIGCRPCCVLDWASDDPAFHPCVREIPAARVLEAAHRVINN
jgi:ADP-heptose:LPS heptosyltransferase